jgi:hypothetical protein
MTREERAIAEHVRQMIEGHEYGPSLLPEWEWSISVRGKRIRIEVGVPESDDAGMTWDVAPGADDDTLYAGIGILAQTVLELLRGEGIERGPAEA